MPSWLLRYIKMEAACCQFDGVLSRERKFTMRMNLMQLHTLMVLN